MSSDNYSVKASQETQEMVSRMVDASGCTSKEFFQILLQSYQMEAIKNGSTRHRELIRESEVMFSRLNQIIVEMATKNDAELLAIQNQQQEKELVQNEQLKTWEGKYNALLENLKIAGNSLEDARKAKDLAEKQAQSAADALEQSKELLSEYRFKNDTLSTIATKNKDKVDKYDQAVAQVTQLTNQLSNLEGKTEQLKNDHQREIEKIADNLLRIQSEAKKDQAAMLDKIEFLQNSFAKERAGFANERSGFDARINDIKKACEREVQLIGENAEAKISAIVTQSANPKRYLSRKAANL